MRPASWVVVAAVLEAVQVREQVLGLELEPAQEQAGDAATDLHRCIYSEATR